MISKKIHSVESVGHLDHDDPCQRRIKHLEGHRRPFLHLGLCLFDRPVREIDELYVLLFRIHHILIPGSFLVFCETDTHPLASRICLVDGFLQLIPVELYLDGQACPDVQHRHIRAVGCVVKVKLLCYCQRIHFVSFSCPHHFIIPPINESRAFSYASVSL